MKKIIFAAFSAVLFMGCNNPPVVTEPIFTLTDINGQALKNEQTVTVTAFDEGIDADKMIFNGYLYSEENFNLEVTVTRGNIADATDELCVSGCQAGNHQATQNFDFVIGAKQQYSVYAHFGERETEDIIDENTGETIGTIEHHLANGDYQIVYDFHEKGYPKASIKITVIYKYVK